ncbi:competence protein CoiA family protein [Photobacterium sanguinicancri]|uniref:competence protein CoiA family protein n=1 Tax=Photobacterium sanguinicancri TaxID=875932 RepID=UPI003D13CCAE
MDSLKVPFGLDPEGNLVPVEKARKSCKYVCPECKNELILKDGGKRAKHLSHPSSSGCSIESIQHKVAKLLINSAIVNNSNGNKTILIQNSCKCCSKLFNSEIPSKTFSAAKEEVKVSDYVCDVVGYRGEDIALAVEIYNTHKVSKSKAAELPVRWIELRAEDVISDNYQWKPIQGHLKAAFCPGCRKHLSNVQKVADRWGVERALYSPIKNTSASQYIAETEVCFKCHKEIPVFWWYGVPFCENEPPKPRPHTIKYRYSKQYGGSYWANTCANCNMIQGDNYLFLFDNAPLKGLPTCENEQEYRSDTIRIVSGKSAASEFMKIITRNI